MDKSLQLEDFNLDLYDEDNMNDDEGISAYSSIAGTNSSTSIVCATLTNFTEGCNYC